MSDGLKAKMERIQERAARQLARELAAAVEVGDSEFLSYASTATSGNGDDFVLGGIFRQAELGRQVAEGARVGASRRNEAAKELHPKYQEEADAYWLRHPEASKVEVARWIERRIAGTKAHTIRLVIQKPMIRKLMSAG